MFDDSIGRYQVGEKLGEGGMGEVYRGFDPDLERTVALKVLSPSLVADEDAIERFRREAKAIAALDHPNVCRIHEIAEAADGRPVIVMPLYEGGTLKQRLRDGPLDPDAACEIASQIAVGLLAAHSKGIVHRDVKTANILITNAGDVKILDFGLAKLRHDAGLTRTGTVMGSPAYMSPEQATGEEVDEKSDVWSLGAVFYEMLAGRLPFEAPYDAALLFSIVHEEPVPLAETGRSLPDGCQAVIDAALRKDSAERPEMAELEQALRDVRARRPTALASAPGTAATASHPVKQPAATAAATPAAAPTMPSGTSRRTWLIGASAASATLVAGALGLWRRVGGTAEPGRPLAIAVLPFLNLSPDLDAEYFGAGLAQDLMTQLSKVGSLRVISRTSTARYAGTAERLPDIAAQLGVTHLVEGSVRKAGDQVRVTVQLIDGATDEHVWAESFDGGLEDVLELQTRLTREIVRALRLEVGAERRRAIETPSTANQQAYDLYLRALYLREQRSPASLRRGVELLRQAVALDPAFAAAYGELGTQQLLLGTLGAAPRDQVAAAVAEAGRKALALDPEAGYGYRIQAALLSLYEWQWDEADPLYRRAIELGDSLARSSYAMGLLLFNLRLDGAQAQIEAAREIDPLSGVLLTNLALVESARRRQDAALALLDEARRLEPGSYVVETRYAQTLVRAGRPADTVALLEKLPVVARDAIQSGWLGMALAASGRPDEARAVLERLQALPSPLGGRLLAEALVRLGLGELDECLTALEGCLAERYPTLGYINPGPEFDPVRGDPRFQAILRAMNLAP